MLQLAHRIIAHFAPQPLAPDQAKELAAFLRILGAAGGTMLDSDPLTNSVGARVAERLGYVSPVWNAGIRLTRKGEQALRPDLVVEPRRHAALSA